MRKLPFWIKERSNPQLGLYCVACGQMTVTAARKAERAIYGDNTMLRFDTLFAYEAKIAALRKAGKSVQV